MTRLPQPGSDDGIWGQILNEFLSAEHNPDGSLKLRTDPAFTGKYTKPSGGIPKTDLDSGVQASLAKADSAPTTLATLHDVNAAGATDSQVLAYDAATSKWISSTVSSSTVSDATTSSKGIVQLAGDLSGNAAAPTLAATTNVASIIASNTTVAGAAQSLAATVVKTGNYTAGTNQLIPADATSAALTVTLPTAPADKSRVTVKKIDSSSNTVTVTAGGSDVFNKSGGSTSVSLALQNQSVTVQYASAAAIWYVVGDDLPLSRLDTRFAPKVLKNSVTCVGDSITNNGGSMNPSTGFLINPKSWLMNANAILNNRLQLISPGPTGPGSIADTTSVGGGGAANGYAFCKGGLTVQNMLDGGYFTAAATSSASIVVVHGGTNDINNNSDGPTVAAALLAGWRILTAAGKTVVATTILPRNSSVITGSKLTAYNAANMLIRQNAAAEPGVVLCDWAAVLLDSSGAAPSGSGASTWTYDGLHPNFAGAWRMAAPLAEVLDRLLLPQPARDGLPVSNSECLTANPFASGNVSGAPTSWSFSTVGSPSSQTKTVVPRIDNTGGSWAQVTTTAANGTTDGFTYNVSNSNLGTDWNIGDTIVAHVEVQGDAAGWDCRRLNLEILQTGSTVQAAANYMSSVDLAAQTATMMPAPTGGLSFVTPRLAISSGVTQVRCVLRFYGSGTIRISRFGLRKVA